MTATTGGAEGPSEGKAQVASGAGVTAKMGWLALVALATAQFLMVLDQSVMNVSISSLVNDFHTTVTTIQAVITLYCLVMAMLIMTGAKIGDIIGRRKAFVIGLIIYACGSALTAASQTVVPLALGWSVLEGIGAGLVFPALAALIAGNFEGAQPKGRLRDHRRRRRCGNRRRAHPRRMGHDGRHLAGRVRRRGVLRRLHPDHDPQGRDARAPRPARSSTIVGSVLSAAGLGVFVYGVLESSTWGWVKPKNSPITIFGFSLTLFVLAAGGVLIWGFVTWQRHREARAATRSSICPWPASHRCGRG